MINGYHIPVLLSEVLEYLQVEKGKWYLDCTLGDGGHSLGILGLGGNVVAIDQDPEAIKRAQERFLQVGIDEKRYELLKGNFGNLEVLISDRTFGGVVFDLGVSSLQVDDAERGFSFNKKGPLDMRMNPDLGVKALDLVNGLNSGELLKLFEKLGEVRDKRVVEAIVEERKSGMIKDTTELSSIIEKAVGRSGRGQNIHPATLYFQALRMAVNDELNSLQTGLAQAIKVTQKNGSICTISFHSLEDRIVKNLYKAWEGEGIGEVITKKPLIPTEGEVRSNPRSRSAKLRVFKKGN